jgi:hypothetical protein
MKKTLATALVLNLLAATAYAQTKPHAKPTPKSAATQRETAKPTEMPEPVLQPFSLDSLALGKIDPKFNGASPATVITALEGMANLKKGEFESTADFNSRRSAAVTKKVVGNAGIDDLFPFVAKVSKFHVCANGVLYGYDADTAQASFYLEPMTEVLGGPDYRYEPGSDLPTLDTFELARDYEKNRTYTASNAYGAETTVVESKGIIYAIASERIPFITGTRAETCKAKSARVSFKIESSIAAQELPSLKALIVIRPKAPYVKYSFFHKSPTRDDPKELNVMTKALYGDVARIVIYSGNSGQIYAQFPDSTASQASTN